MSERDQRLMEMGTTATRAECRRAVLRIVEAWGEQRDVSVKELCFRLRTSPLKDGKL